MSEVRAALGDDARKPRYVRTLHRHGYAFVAAVEGPVGEAVSGAPGAAACWIERGSWRLPLGEGVHVLGRDADAAIPIASTRASRRHAQIRVTGLDAQIEDLGSKNGTFLDGKQLDACAGLVDGSEICIGDEVFVFKVPASGARTETATKT